MPVACVHDEILVEVPLADAQATQAWLTNHMVEAMREIVADRVPILVEAVIGKNWAGTPLSVISRRQPEGGLHKEGW